MGSLKPADLLPRWTKPVSIDSGARDPLGMSRVANALTDRLLKGIITTTDRARYYSLYCWVLWHIEHHDRPKDYDRFKDAFQRREAAIALATYVNDHDSSFVGVQKTKPVYERDQGKKEIQSDFPTLKKHLGGYGQYYAGCLFQLGLTRGLGPGIDGVAAGPATSLAEAVHKTVADTPYVAERLFAERTVPLKSLERTAKYLSIDAIRSGACREEREILIDVFFGITHRHDAEDSTLRRESLLRLLHLVGAYEDAGVPLVLETLETQVVYGPAYYNVLLGSKGKPIPLTLPEALRSVDLGWRQWCLQQYLTLAMEWLLSAVLQCASPESDGLSIPQIGERLVSTEFHAWMALVTGGSCKTPCALLSRVGMRATPSKDESAVHQARIGYSHPLSEESILEHERESPAEDAAMSCSMLAVLYAKWRGMEADASFQGVRDPIAGADPWAGAILPDLDVWFDPALTWPDALSRLMKTWVVELHDRIKYDKRRLESSWLQVVEGRVWREREYEPYARPSRHRNAFSILRDLLLVAEEDDAVKLTPAGHDLLKRLNP